MEDDIGKYPPAELLTKARSALDTCELGLAKAFIERALSLDDSSAEGYELLGQVAMEEGEDEAAVGYLKKSVELSPESGYSKYMYLGQLHSELQAIEYFTQGVRLMQQELEGLEEGSAGRPILARQISCALVAMTEIYLTDCCFEENAESQCEAFLAQAQSVDPSNAEVYQTLASVRTSQSRSEEAKELLLHSLTLWSPTDTSDGAWIPSFHSRLGLVRLLLEMDMDDRTEEILASLVQEDDEIVDVWYLWGFTYYRQAERAESEEERQEALADAQECLNTAIGLYEKTGCEDTGILEHTQEMLTHIQSLLPSTTNGMETEEQMGKADEWETDEEAMGDE